MTHSVIERRWEQGLDHDPRSEEIFELLRDSDVDDYFEWKSGGDGDNGEALMFLLDEHFENQDNAKE